MNDSDLDFPLCNTAQVFEIQWTSLAFQRRIKCRLCRVAYAYSMFFQSYFLAFPNGKLRRTTFSN